MPAIFPMPESIIIILILILTSYRGMDVKLKGKGIPVQTSYGPIGFQKFEAPRFLTIGT
jgi:hypothetical protein